MTCRIHVLLQQLGAVFYGMHAGKNCSPVLVDFLRDCMGLVFHERGVLVSCSEGEETEGVIEE